MIAYLLLAIYLIALSLILLFSLGQFHLAWWYSKSKSGQERDNRFEDDDWPLVTVQLPLYNERYVVERLVRAVCALDYPKDKLEIQVLDDSSDITTDLATKEVEHFSKQGINIQLHRRQDRSGYKAGALDYGLSRAEGEFVAIFDADFLPEPNFLKQILPHFNADTGMVQARWEHLNRNYSLLTRLQAFGLDGHFTVEQSGRQAAGSYINFNGTAGIWRKTCIEEAGGWQFDTLTEDLDLSYRAQLAGWQMSYVEDITVPAELPVAMSAVKTQQYRWNKGAAETARKLAPSLVRSVNPFRRKLHGLLHLFNSSVYIYLFLAAILSVPMLFIKFHYPSLELVFHLASLFVLGFAAIAFFYWESCKKISPRKTWKYYLVHFPLFLSVSMGLSLYNAIAVIEGYAGKRSAFIRTPKFNVGQIRSNIRQNVYLSRSISWITILEGLLALYFIFGVITGFLLGDFGLILFHALLAMGFFLVFFYTVKTGYNGSR